MCVRVRPCFMWENKCRAARSRLIVLSFKFLSRPLVGYVRVGEDPEKAGHVAMCESRDPAFLTLTQSGPKANGGDKEPQCATAAAA